VDDESGGTPLGLSREFKLEAVKLVAERRVTVAQVAKDVHENVLCKWVRELREA
jgi:transposase-like protein